MCEKMNWSYLGGGLVSAIVIGIVVFGTGTSICVAEEAAGPDTEASLANKRCEPACRGSFICENGACMSPCQPLCRLGEQCSKEGKCILPEPPRESPPPNEEENDATHASVDEAAALGLIREDIARKKEKERRAKHRRFAVMINPGALAILPALYGVWTIPLSFQMGFTHFGFDINVTPYWGEFVGAAGEVGLRILPFGKGLPGLYIVPRIGGGYPMGFMVSGEIGYAFMPGHLALNFGGGGGYASEVGALPFGNVSIGIGF